MNTPIEPFRPSKATRRFVLRASLVFCSGWISYILYHGGDSSVREAGLWALIGFMSWIVYVYIKGGSDDVKSYNETLTKLKSGSSDIPAPKDEDLV